MILNKQCSFSVIIPTIHRHNDLEAAIKSVLRQTYKPIEIIIIDQSTDNLTRDICEQNRLVFLAENVNLIYYHSKKRGLTPSRNIGIQLAKGDYLTFLDDDAVLDECYLYEIKETIKSKDAVLVQGIIANYRGNYSLGKYLLKKFFFLGSISKEDGNVSAAFSNSLPVQFSKEISCMWVSGCNHTVKASIAQALKYDENLVAYALYEDVDFSYRVFKKYPLYVWATPKAIVHHFESPRERIGNKKLIYVDAVQRYYMYRKNIDRNWYSSLIYMWSLIGKIIIAFLLLLSSKKSFLLKWSNLTTSIVAELFVIRHRKKIRCYNLEFFHEWLRTN